MKILHFIYGLGQGGAERFVIDLANSQSHENEVILYVLRDDSVENQGFFVPEIGENVVYMNLKIRPGFRPMLMWRFYKIIKTDRPDVVHCHLNLVNYFFMLSLFKHKHIKFIYTIHSSSEIEVQSELERVIRRYFFKYRYFTPVAISHETKSNYNSFYKLNDIDVIYNGRNLSGKTESFEEVLTEVENLKSTTDSLVFCHLARYNKLKNQELLIKVFNRLKDEGEDIILLIIGDGFENENDLLNLAKEHIHFMGAKSNVMDYLYASDAFCLSSLNEGMPISLIEAFACGCIPICTPVGGIINSIEHGVTGFLSKSVTEDDYLEAVREFIRSRYKIDKNLLVQYYHDNFSIEMCKHKYLELYQVS